MPRARTSMRQIRDVLRHFYREGYSKRLIGHSLHLARATVRKYLCRAEALGLSWPLPDGLTDDVLEAMFFPESRSPAKARYQPDWEAVNKQMSRKHVTLANGVGVIPYRLPGRLQLQPLLRTLQDVEHLSGGGHAWSTRRATSCLWTLPAPP